MRHETSRSSQGQSEARDWRWWGTRLLAGAVGLVLLTAGVSKAMDMELFIRQLRDYQIISGRVPLALSAWGLIALECALGAALIVFYRPRVILLVTGGLWLVFLGALSWAWATGVTEDCGCFGAWAKRTPAQAVTEDLLLLAATAFAWVGQRGLRAPRSRARAWVVAAACAAGLALPVVFGFPIQAISQPPSRTEGMDLGDLRVEGLDQYNLAEGAYLLILMDTECSHCQDAVPEFNALAESAELPPVVAICHNDEAQRMIFAETYQANFPIAGIREDDFWRLLADGDTPRTMLVRDRRIQQVWNTDVPSQDAIRAALRPAFK